MPYTVYLSSTLKDLEDERAAVKQALGEDCVVRTSYRASEQDLVTSCLDDVGNCDAYILIVGLRYGFVPEEGFANAERLSITELESRRARDKPRMVFLKDADHIPYGRTDARTKENPPERIEAFRSFLSRPDQPRPAVFVTPQDLGVAVTKAFADFKERRSAAPVASGAARAAAWLEAHLQRVETLHEEHSRVTALRAEATGLEPVLDLAVARWREAEPSQQPTPQDIERRPLDEVLAQGPGALLIVGEGGGGKTTSLLRAAATAARRARAEASAPVPAYVNLARPGGAGELAALRERVAESVAWAKDWDEWVELLAASGRRAVYFFDAFNEMAERGQADAVVALQRFAEKQADDACIVASRRVPHLEPLLRGASSFRTWEILRLVPEQVQGFLADLGLETLFEQLSQELLSLAGNPFMLLAIARTLAGESGHTLPRNRGRLYERFVRGWMDRESLKPSRGLRYSYERVKQPVLARLAVRMTALGQTSLVEGDALDALLASELDRIEQRTHRLGGLPKDWTVDDCVTEVVGDGLLRRAGGALRFMHQSLQEFYAGLHFRAADPDALVAFTPAFVDDERSPDPALPAQRFVSALLMMAGLLDDATAVVRALQARNPLLAAAALASANAVDGHLVAEIEAGWLAGLDREAGVRDHALASACAALARTRNPVVLQRLVALALDPDFDTAYGATRALKRHAGWDVVLDELIAQVVAADDDALEAQRLRIRWLLRDAPPRSSAETLVRAWRGLAAGSPQRGRVERMLATAQGPELEAALGAGAQADELRSRLAEIEGMGLISAKEIRRVMAEATRRHEERRDEAFATLEGAGPDALAAALCATDVPTRSAAALRIAAGGLTSMAGDLLQGLLRGDDGMRDGDDLLQALVKLDGEEGAVRRLETAMAAGSRLVGRLPAEMGARLALDAPVSELRAALDGLGLRGNSLTIDRAEPLADGVRWRAGATSWSRYRPTYAIDVREGSVEVHELSLGPRVLGWIGRIPGAAAQAVLERALVGDESESVRLATEALIERGWTGISAWLQDRLAAPSAAPERVEGLLESLTRLPDADPAWALQERFLIRNEGNTETHPRWGRHEGASHGWSDALHGILVAKQADAAARDAIAAALDAPDAALHVTALLELRAWLGDQALGSERLNAWLASGLVERAQALALQEPDDAVRQAAASSVARHVDGAVLLATLQGTDVDRAIAAADVLAQSENDTWRAAVGTRMAPLAVDRSLDPALRRRAGAALSRVGQSSLVYGAITERLNARDDAPALERIDLCLIALPDDANLHWWRGHALHGLGRLAEAAESFEHSARLVADAPMIPRTLASLYLRLGDSARALDEARRGVAIDPADADSQAMLAWTLYRAGEDDEAAAAAATTLQLDPVQTEARWIALLVALRARRAGDAETALAHLRRALGHLGATLNPESRDEIQAELRQFALSDDTLRGLRDDALALAGAT